MIPFRTVTGRVVDLMSPAPSMINTEDISWGLANQCRFVGQMRHFYSLAQHALLVASLLPVRLRFKGLNHDNTEAYMGDVSRFLKHSTYLTGYRWLEHNLGNVIDDALNIGALSTEDLVLLHAADDLAAVFEHTTLRTVEPFDPSVHLPRAIETGFITRTTLEDLRDLLPALSQSHPANNNGRYRMLSLSPVSAQNLWMAEFKFLDELRRAL